MKQSGRRKRPLWFGMKRILGVTFSPYGQLCHFFCEDPDIGPGDHVVAETVQGTGLARVVAVMDSLPPDLPPENVKTLLRKADETDLLTAAENGRQAATAKKFCASRIEERGLDMKLVDVEMLFDRSKLVFYFTAPTRIDFRELVKDLVREYHTRIELRQIGVRHETQMLGAVGSCGMVCCCRRFLRKFVPVTIKMAKEQNLFLNPTKISGICGRLLCCLSYEQENYDTFHRNCPRLGKRYHTSRGPMRVVRANMFRNSVVVMGESNEEQELSLEEWQELNPRRPEVPAGKTESRNGPRSRAGEEFMVITADPDMLDRGEDAFFSKESEDPAGFPAEDVSEDGLASEADIPTESADARMTGYGTRVRRGHKS